MITKEKIKKALVKYMANKDVYVGVKRTISKPTPNAKKLIALIKKEAINNNYIFCFARSADYYGDETSILLVSDNYPIRNIRKLLDKFCKSIGFEYDKLSRSFDAYGADAIYTLKGTESFVSLYSYSIDDLDIFHIQIRENVE